MNTSINKTFSKHNIHAVVLCGGSGTRLWPLSRSYLPKQFLSLDGSGDSLLQKSLHRLDNITPPKNRWLVLSSLHETHAKQQCDALAANILVEPMARNTAPAVAWAAWNILQKDPDSTMVILSSDHVIDTVADFEETISRAVELALLDNFVVIGIRPTYPATGFGYVELGENTVAGGFKVTSFREKPNEALAKEFLLTGKYLWNAGMFIWKTRTFWKALQEIAPEITKAFENSNADNIGEVYASLPKTPIDITFMEKTKNVACVPALFNWNDIGSYKAIKECMPLDKNYNSIVGDVLALQTNNSIVHSTGPFVATLGVSNLTVIATKDAVLVMPIEQSENLKAITSYLQQNNRHNLL